MLDWPKSLDESEGHRIEVLTRDRRTVTYGVYYRGGKRIMVSDMPVDEVERLLEWKLEDPRIVQRMKDVQKPD